MLLRHGICCMDTRDVFLWEKNMSFCWSRVYVFLLEENIWIWKMSSCWRRIYGYARCLLVVEEYMAMEDVSLFFFVLVFVLIIILILVLFRFLFLCCCLKLFKCALRLAAGAFFCEKNVFWKNDISKNVKNIFC